MRNNDWLDCWKKEKLVCPYCYEELEIEDYIHLIRNPETDKKFTCPNCNKEFYGFGEIEYKFTSNRIDKDGEPQEMWDNDEEENTEVSNEQ